MIFIQLAKYHATFKISFNFLKYIMQLSKYRSTFLNISCNSQNNMQLRKGVYFLGTCIMNSEKLWVLRPGHALVVGKVAGKGENLLI